MLANGTLLIRVQPIVLLAIFTFLLNTLLQIALSEGNYMTPLSGCGELSPVVLLATFIGSGRSLLDALGSGTTHA
jgi:hypothetical protein